MSVARSARPVTAPSGGRSPFRHPSVRAYLLLSPMLALLGFGVVAPLAIFCLYSLWKKVGFDIVRELTLANYLFFFTHPVYFGLIAKALVYGFIVAGATLVLAYPVAYYVTTRVRLHKNAYLIAALIPLYTSDLVRIFAWRSVLGVNGFINKSLQGLGLIEEPIEFLLFSPTSAVITLTHMYFPFMFLAVWAGLETVKFSEVEAAWDLGARWFRTLRRVVFPLSLPGVIAGFLFVFIPVTGDYLAINLMGGPDGITITNAVVEQFGAANNWPLGAVLAVMVLAAIVLVLAVLAIFLSRLRSVRMYSRAV
jgi:spermidine/putrescine transport system permease protein